MAVSTKKMMDEFKIQLDKMNEQNKIMNESFSKLSTVIDETATNYNNQQTRLSRMKSDRRKKGLMTTLEYSREKNRLNGREEDCMDFFIIPVGKFRGHEFQYLKSQKDYCLYLMTTNYISKRLRTYIMNFFKFSETEIKNKKYYLEKNPVRRQKLRAELEEEYKKSRSLKED